MMGFITDVIFVPSRNEFDCLRDLIITEKSTIASPIKCVMEPKKGSVMILDYENFACAVVQSGFGMVATSQTAYSVIKEYGNKLERVFMIGSAYSEKKTVFKVEKCFQEFDLRLFDYELGESPDQPMYYKADTDLFEDVEIADSLTISHGVPRYPDLSEYSDMQKDNTLVDTEDYQFLASFYGLPIKKYILRSILGPSYQFCDDENIERCMKELWDIIGKHFGNK